MSGAELGAARATLQLLMAALEVAQAGKPAATVAAAAATTTEEAAVVPSVPTLQAFNFEQFKKV